ncbi:MAG: hypothetical protein ABJA82_15705, partial [Myxococcales bacterium]
ESPNRSTVGPTDPARQIGSRGCVTAARRGCQDRPTGRRDIATAAGCGNWGVHLSGRAQPERDYNGAREGARSTYAAIGRPSDSEYPAVE